MTHMKYAAAVSVLVGALGLSACSDGSRNDAVISSNIKQQLNDQRVPGSISVSTDKGVVTLTGGVPDVQVKERAESIAKTTAGVQYVVNSLHTTIAGDAPVRHDIPVPNNPPSGGIPPQLAPPGGMNVPPQPQPPSNLQ